MRHALQVWSEQGHCSAPRDQLVALGVELLEIPEAVIEPAIEAERAAENLIGEATDAGELIYLTPLHRAEAGCANQIWRLLEFADLCQKLRIFALLGEKVAGAAG